MLVRWICSFCVLLFLSACVSDLDKIKLHLTENQVLVKPGDTLYGLAISHKVTPKQLARANYLRSSQVVPGQVLLIPPVFDVTEGIAQEIQRAPYLSRQTYGKQSLRNEVAREKVMARGTANTPKGARLLVDGGKGLHLPVDGHMIDPSILGLEEKHPVVYFAAPIRANVIASQSGYVRFVLTAKESEHPIFIVLQHDGGRFTTYGCLSKALVAKGQKVMVGESIGQAGRIKQDARRTGLRFQYLLEEPGKDNLTAIDPRPLFVSRE